MDSLKDQNVVVLYSGGPDSYLTFKWAQAQEHKSLLSMYVQLGHRYQNHEVDAVLATIPTTSFEMCLQWLGSWEEADAHIFGRNAFLCLVAAKRLPPNEEGIILLTVQKDELEIPDRTPEFMAHMSEVLSTLKGSRILVETPWWSQDKTDMVGWYLANYPKDKEEELFKTFSCYRPMEISDPDQRSFVGKTFLQCGDCPACFRRAVAFSLNGLIEPYAEHPFQSKTSKEYAKRVIAGKYSKDRGRRIMDAIRRFSGKPKSK